MSVEPDMPLVEALTKAERMVIFTGAGISTASGIPDYRGPEGLWKTRQPVFFQDFMHDEAARLEYWTQKSEDWAAFGAAEPNAVHRAIVDLEKAGKVFLVLTQNIDGLHAAAGTSPARLVELHGTNREVACMRCHARHPAPEYYETFAQTKTPPVCACGGFIKPATISFGQDLLVSDMKRAQEAVFSADLMIALGSTLSVQPAANFTILAARQGCPYYVINRGPTAHDGHPLVTRRLEGDVLELFPAAVDAALAMFG
ncbi:MAG: NAD-dependent deacetylase [Kiritimatiellia bacterium]